MLGTRHVVVLLAEMKQIIEGKVEELANLESKELKELFVRNLRVELFWVLHHVLYVVFHDAQRENFQKLSLVTIPTSCTS